MPCRVQRQRVSPSSLSGCGAVPLAGKHAPSGPPHPRSQTLRCAGSPRAAVGRWCPQSICAHQAKARCAIPKRISTSSPGCTTLGSSPSTCRRRHASSTKSGARCAGGLTASGLCGARMCTHCPNSCTARWRTRGCLEAIEFQLRTDLPLPLPSPAPGALSSHLLQRPRAATPTRRHACSSPPTWACTRRTTPGCLMVGAS